MQTKPTLVWRLNAVKGGGHDCEISYLTAGLNWRADHVLVSSPQDDKMDLKAWVTIDNNSGATYQDAKLTPVAGYVNRAEPEGGHRGKALPRSAMAEDAPSQFAA